MDSHRPSGKNTYIAYLALLVISGGGILGVLYLSRHWSQRYPVPFIPVYILIVLLSLALSVRLWLGNLRRTGRARGIVAEIAENGLARTLILKLIVLMRHVWIPGFKLPVLAGLIFCLVGALALGNVLFDQNIELLNMVEKYGLDDRREEPGVMQTPVTSLNVYTQGRGTEARLQLMLRITQDLRNAGANLVVLEEPAPVNRAYYNNLLGKIEATGIAVFAHRDFWPPEMSWQSRQFAATGFSPDSLRRQVGVFSFRPWRITGQRYTPGPVIYCVPYGYISVYSTPFQMHHDTIPDVCLEVLRRWRNYPESMKPVRTGREVLLGGDRIPVSPAGLAIARPFVVPTARFMAGDDYTRDRAGYRWIASGADTMREDLKGFESEIRGKVVVLNWHDPVVRDDFSSWFDGPRVSAVVASALSNGFLTVRDDVHLPATALVLLAALLLVRWLRPIASAGILLLLGVLMLYGGAWLYTTYNVIVEVIYPLAAAGLGVVILPLARILAEVQGERETG